MGYDPEKKTSSESRPHPIGPKKTAQTLHESLPMLGHMIYLGEIKGLGWLLGQCIPQGIVRFDVQPRLSRLVRSFGRRFGRRTRLTRSAALSPAQRLVHPEVPRIGSNTQPTRSSGGLAGRGKRRSGGVGGRDFEQSDRSFWKSSGLFT